MSPSSYLLAPETVRVLVEAAHWPVLAARVGYAAVAQARAELRELLCAAEVAARTPNGTINLHLFLEALECELQGKEQAAKAAS